MPTPTDIANLALSRLGEPRISDLNDNSPNAITCRLHYDTVRDSLLRSHPWNFATGRVELTQLEDAPVFGWSYAYELPADWIRLSTLNGAEAKRRGSNYQIEGNQLLTNASVAKITYVKKVTDPNAFDDLFLDVFAFRLAAAIAMDVSGSEGKRDGMEQMAALRLADASFVDAGETAPEVLSPLSGSPGLASRGGYGLGLGGFAHFGNAPDSDVELNDGADGQDGWTPRFAVVSDGERRVLQVTGWEGGEGDTPEVGYVGVSGLVATVGTAIDIRGATGPIGPFGTNLWRGDDAPEDPETYPLWWKSDIGLLFIWYDDGTSEQWVSAVGAGPVGPSAYDSYVATTDDDPVLGEADWAESFGENVTLDSTVADIFGLTAQVLSADDAGADKGVFWDESAGKLTHHTYGTGLTMTGTVLSASAVDLASPGPIGGTAPAAIASTDLECDTFLIDEGGGVRTRWLSPRTLLFEQGFESRCGVAINAAFHPTFQVGTTAGYAFVNATSFFGTAIDCQFTFSSPGVAELNNGTVGTLRDLLLRTLHLDKTITAGGTAGAQTINKSAGSVNFAAAATSLVVTNSLVTTSSVIHCTIATNDTTMTAVQVVAGSGSFTIYAPVAPTAETRVNFFLTN